MKIEDTWNKIFITGAFLATVLVTLACTISYEGVNFGSDPDIDFIEDQTATAAAAHATQPARLETTPEPAYQPAPPQGSNAETANAGSHEYSVTGTDFECVCQVDGNTTAGFNFVGDKLEFTTSGGAVDVYDKITENTFKRSFMGYYILSSGTGDQATESIVEEEKHVVIILNDQGYVMEHYSGDAASPCCYHTFTLVK